MFERSMLSSALSVFMMVSLLEQTIDYTSLCTIVRYIDIEGIRMKVNAIYSTDTTPALDIRQLYNTTSYNSDWETKKL